MKTKIPPRITTSSVIPAKAGIQKIPSSYKNNAKKKTNSLKPQNQNNLNKSQSEIGEAPKGWKYKKLANLCHYSTGKTPVRKNLNYWSNGEIPWVSISDMKQGETIFKTKEKISKQAFEEIFKNKKLVPKNTLLMSFKLTIGRTCFSGIDLVHNEAIIAIYPKKDMELDKQYLSFYLPTVDYSIYQDRAIKGNTLNQSKINKIKIPIPPLEEQKKIAGILQTLDQKIEHHENKKSTLEELFKSMLNKLMTGQIRVHNLEYR